MSDERYSVREERRSRKQLSCAECHRLKLKCDRQVPCSNCVRRECAELCPNSVRVKKSPRVEDSGVVSELRERLSAIEGLLSRLGDRSRSRSPSRDRRGRKRKKRGRGDSDYDRSLSSRSPSGSPRFDYRDRRDERPYERSEGRDRGEHSSRGDRSRKGKGKLVPSTYASPLDHPLDHPTSSSLGTVSMMPQGRTPAMMPSVSRDSRAVDDRERDIRDRATSRDRGREYDRDRDGQPTSDFVFRYDRRSYPTTPVPPEESYGTLVIDPGGRSKWLGPTAGTEWLKNQEMSEAGSSRRTRSPSPRSPQASAFEHEGLFPFQPWGPAPTMETIGLHLPPFEDATVLLDAYYQNYAWNHDVAPRRCLQPIFDQAYDLEAPEVSRRKVHPQQLALLFIIMAMGALHNPALPAHDPSAEHYLASSRWCLVKGDFMGHNTIAGLQAVVIMAHYHLETEKGRNGDSAWPLWGVAMRLVTAMGLHRDGARWNLPEDVVEERRHVFWECHTIDVFQANCFSRPSALRPEHIDAEFPSQTEIGQARSFRTLKFELCRISGAVLDQAMDVRTTPYTAITSLYDRLCAFERQIPFHLRCRTALIALPSVYADAESATRDSPEVNRGDLHVTFQQFTLALNVSECIMFLQRPYFVKALQEAPQDPTRSVYGKSYLAVVERCNVLIEVVAGLHELYPTVTARHWFFWYHLFTAAVCIGTMIIKNSSNPLAGFALGQIDYAINLYSSVLRDHATPSLVQNHQWLLRLRQRALSKIESERHTDPEVDDQVDVELLGWRTRLIERARQPHRSRTNRGSAPSSLSPAAPPPAPIDQVLQQHFAVPEGSRVMNPELSTDLFLHQFWDPTTLLEANNNDPSLTNANWWAGFDPTTWGA